MLSEAQWQSQLIKSARDDHNGWAIRMAALQRYGCPDLFIQIPGYASALIETKIVSIPNLAKGGSITLAATLLQRETIRSIQQAGGLAGFWVLVNDRLILVGGDSTQEYLHIGEAEALTKERGRPWPLPALLHRTAAAMRQT